MGITELLVIVLEIKYYILMIKYLEWKYHKQWGKRMLMFMITEQLFFSVCVVQDV